VDLNFDGRIDSTMYFDDQGLLRQAVRSDFEIEMASSMRSQPFNAGKIVRKDRETNLDGKLDTWELLSK